ncbi:MAG TPA: threonine--tRNA ligase [Candidatus Paceibacterota bacterium]
MSNIESKRHSLAHLLAAAVLDLYPGTKQAIGPAIENGFYYDFDLPSPLSDTDLPNIEKKMREILKTWKEFSGEEVSEKEAKKRFKDNPYKLELIDEVVSKSETLTLYTSGGYVDLCRGGHVEKASELDPKAFALTHLAGAYWRGDEKNKMLTRIYGLAFDTKEELEKYLLALEESKKRDHRVLGPKLDLFFFDEASPGIPFYTPRGEVIRETLRNFIRDVSYGDGYDEVKLPLIFDSEVWKASGHWEHFKDDMFVFKVEKRDFALKPMNCPGHMILFKHGLHSYRDLPIRYAEMSTLHRNELSGTLSGLTRVRGFVQDDTHIFLMPDQITDEVIDLLNRIKKIYGVFGMKIEDVHLSTRPEKFLGEEKEWDQAEKALASALRKAKWEYQENPGQGAFYGPKIDMQISDILGRKWQLATIQLDFQMPSRFGLEYVDKDGDKKTPIVIHRALLGSFERFFAILIETYAGAFPAWLSPVQVKILPISEKFNEYGHNIFKKLKRSKIRVEVDESNDTLGKKIREAELQKIPYLLIIGEKEVTAETVAVRQRSKGDLGPMSLDQFKEHLLAEIKEKR